MKLAGNRPFKCSLYGVLTLNFPNEPQLSDLRESGAIEQDADIVMFLYRPWYYGVHEDEHGESTNGKAYAMVKKHRNGALQDIELHFNSARTHFSDPSYETMKSDAMASDDSFNTETTGNEKKEDEPF